jgi:hypothetical protein
MQVHALPFVVHSIWNLECHWTLIMPHCNSPNSLQIYACNQDTDYTSDWESLQESTNEFYVPVS